MSKWPSTKAECVLVDWVTPSRCEWRATGSASASPNSSRNAPSALAKPSGTPADLAVRDDNLKDADIREVEVAL
jgi:hypothetical protein